MGEPSQGRRGTGGQTEVAMRYAKCGEPKVVLKVTCCCEVTRVAAGERSDTETVTLRSERGDWKRAIVGWYLASRLLNLGYPFQYMCADDELHPSLFHIALYLLILERISQVARTADTNISGAIQVFFMP
jgi:hypothetical protein